MIFRVLGKLEIRADGTDAMSPRDNPPRGNPPQRRAVLAALVVDAGQPVPVPTLVHRVWDDAPPVAARAALHAHIARIRRLLSRPGGPLARIRHSGTGYLLDVDPDRVDLHRFRRLVACADQPSRGDDERARVLREALELWRGTPLADVPGAWAGRARYAMELQLVGAAVAWAEAELRLDRPARVAELLTDLVFRHPLAEPLVSAQMRALCARGRRAEALAAYATTRRHLVEQLGTEPGPELRALHESILREELDRPPETIRVNGERATGPAQIPLDVAGFVGRDEELRHLDGLLEAADPGPAPAVAALVGAAGVGKTALAIHWAHRVADRFPDGQLYVDLRGYAPDEPMPARAALAGFLRALGEPEPATAGDTAELAARFRSRMANARMLVVLDNAGSAEHARPLLPGRGPSLALVTSRDALSGLVVREGARRFRMEALSVADSMLLLRTAAGEAGEAAEPDAPTLAAYCAGLPLALRVVAELATRPDTTSDALLAQLADPTRRLTLLDAGGDPRCGLSAVLSWSLRSLDAPARHAFGLLGRYAGRGFDASLLASLANLDVGEAKRIIDALVHAHLVVAHPQGGYTMPDLVHAYAATLTSPRRHQHLGEVVGQAGGGQHPVLVDMKAGGERPVHAPEGGATRGPRRQVQPIAGG